MLFENFHMMKFNVVSFVPLLGVVLRSVIAIPTISAIGSKFFTSERDQYFVKGIAYQPSPEDPLIDTEQCMRDAALMKELGANAIRVYHVSEDGDHNGCMKAFEEAGIYLFLDLDTFTSWIQPDTPQWNETQFRKFSRVLDAFHGFQNLAGLFVGNEVLTKPENAPAARYVKAAAADMKKYRDHMGYREIPIGYSAADIAQLRPMLQNYLVCGKDSANTIDFFGLNAYEWCDGGVNFETSGYAALQDQAQDYPIPILFSETGCNTHPPRQFGDQAVIFGDEMVDTWSGAIVYEWIQEINQYGLINYDGQDTQEGFARKGVPIPVQPDFENLKKQWATLTPKGVNLVEYASSASKVKVPECPSTSGWATNGDSSLPTIGAEKLDLAIPPNEPTESDTEPKKDNDEPGLSGSATDGGIATMEITKMSAALVGVMLGFMMWL